MNSLIRIREPRLEFAFGQSVEDPRDGLTLFGPYDTSVYGVRAGVIGTKDGIRRFNRWVKSIQEPVGIDYAERYRPPFPGFEAAFRIPWKTEPIIEVEIDPVEIDRCLQTYYGSEVPIPISVTVNRGEADIQTVMRDILALTKLNYNSCRHSDGLPVTLKFADAVGEILVSGPQKSQDPPLPFRHYI